jgi:hypothetical protein
MKVGLSGRQSALALIQRAVGGLTSFNPRQKDVLN